MITIQDEALKKLSNFWNHCLFHPTDAVEDAWGKRILDRIAKDGSIKSIRIYAMLEDVVYLDENDELQFDFRTSDLRIDYLLEKGFTPLIAYAGMPTCIADDTHPMESNSKNKTRYKGKLFNTNPPRDYALWEEVCYRYTLHNIERYGIEVMKDWRLTCFNEPDISGFFLGMLENDDPARIPVYTDLYAAFARGVRRASAQLKIGGPTLAGNLGFLDGFLKQVKERDLPIDFIALHNYGTWPGYLESGEKKLSVENNVEKTKNYLEVIAANGFDHLPLIFDEWGAASHGFSNTEKFPSLWFRENEIYASYYTKWIYRCLANGFKIDRVMICLSGQHEMTEDFSGFRNFFTLNFIAKPIYNAYLMASKLGDTLLKHETNDENLSVIPTKTTDGGYAVLLTYADETFTEDIPSREEVISFPEDAIGKKISVFVIDRENTNPYRLAKRMNIGNDPSKEEIAVLREEGRLKPISVEIGSSSVTLKLTPNCTYLVTVSE